tara:strand:+ start:264 stop:434 length:171 start_codon:yes stop_codon:yes gene_type:complete
MTRDFHFCSQPQQVWLNFDYFEKIKWIADSQFCGVATAAAQSNTAEEFVNKTSHCP